MDSDTASLFLICGKIAAGKSTLANELSVRHHAVLISQDEWLSTLYPSEIENLQDYARYSERFYQIMGLHLVSLLKNGTSVVLDFPANTLKVRQWMKGVADTADCHCELHFLDVPDDVCLERLEARNLKGAHEYKVTKEEFELFSKYFVAPSESEGFQIVIHAI